MPRALVTRLAQEWGTNLEKGGLRRPVRIVAVGTVLRDRLMLPQKWTAKFRVAAGARLGDGVLDKLRRRSGTMRRVARCACHCSFA